jgi:phospholipid/cholesterol/gamma-HCH transport system ATP-binding protein
MIEIQHIAKTFGDKVILEDISAQFKPGMCNLIIGASGSGKTVLTKCIVDLIQTDEGHIYFDGIELDKMSKEQRKELRNNIGMLFQGNALFDSMTVEENVKFPLDMISGGMKKRVGLARALVLNPKYLFCDEPNSGLDPQTSMVIDKLIHELTVENNITTIVVTHDMNSVMEIGDYILYLHQGHKEWEGSNKDIIYCKNELLNNFIFASEFLQDAKTQRMLEDKK